MKKSVILIIFILIFFALPSVLMCYVELVAGSVFTGRQWMISIILLVVSIFLCGLVRIELGDK